MFQFLHLADLHLDSPLAGASKLPPAWAEALKGGAVEAFDRAIAHAVKEQVDFVLIAGDVYDSEMRSLQAQYRFAAGMEALGKAGIRAFVIHGNHDHLGGAHTRLALPDNVYTFGAEPETASFEVRGERICITGFSYPQRHVREPMHGQYPQADGQSFHIGLLHGSESGDASHAVYAPFSIGGLQAKDYDYWALGHIHDRRMLASEPPIAYPGCLQGRHRKERGDKGFYSVTVERGVPTCDFIPAATILFEEVEADCAGVRDAADLLERLGSTAQGAARPDRKILLDIKASRLGASGRALFAAEPLAEWLELLREQMAGDERVWVRSLLPAPPERGELDDRVSEALLAAVDSWPADRWKDVLASVERHKDVRKLLPLGAAPDKERVIARIAQLLFKERQEGGR